MFKRLLVAAYGLICYAVFFATYLYAVGFVGNLLVPRTIDGPPAGIGRRPWSSIWLLLAFALQHSVMARRASSAGGRASSRKRRSAAPMCCSPAWR